MNPHANSIWLVILLGVVSTIQNHLAKALERHGIDSLHALANRSRRREQKDKGNRKKFLIYIIGLILNQTVFIYHLLITPLGGTTAMYTSMYGVGLLVLLLYSVKVLKEPLNRQEWLGALTIVIGTSIIGVEGLQRPPINMALMNVSQTMQVISILLSFCAIVIFASLRSGSRHTIALGFGFSAGAIGVLDPLFKGIGQTHGGGNMYSPQNSLGWIIFIGSFLAGFLSFLIDQWGFYLRARVSILVPTFNATYITIPVFLQVFFLPGYNFHVSTILGLSLIIFGFIKLGNFSAVYHDSKQVVRETSQS